MLIQDVYGSGRDLVDLAAVSSGLRLRAGAAPTFAVASFGFCPSVIEPFVIPLSIQDLYLTLPLDAVDRFKVIFVPDLGLGPRIDGGYVKGEAHPILLQKEAGALPVHRHHPPVGPLRLCQIPHDHARTSIHSFSTPSFGAFSGTSERASMADSSSMARPRSSSSSVMVRGMRHLRT
ncbi:MAG: hypothetical protein A4E51_00208 [Methanosaeta sp. PtaU1.Bin055]|nr:MAG: hypothetical protein A4E51_00208 [Methanosaeta sp. PtaU1.Bin055]